MDNPFESGHIKNYILSYIAVVVIMVLFFIASSLWNDIEKHPKKEFATKPLEKRSQKVEKETEEKPKYISKIKLLDSGY
ncbi:MAG: hypothetical protein GXO11_05785 [Epsilonproteobacteria bacterium]|nr:hypothetical protein [Campylobacterota bacterium]